MISNHSSLFFDIKNNPNRKISKQKKKKKKKEKKHESLKEQALEKEREREREEFLENYKGKKTKRETLCRELVQDTWTITKPRSQNV